MQEGVRFTGITEWPEFMVHPEVGGQAESTGRVVFYIVAPACIVGAIICLLWSNKCIVFC